LTPRGAHANTRDGSIGDSGLPRRPAGHRHPVTTKVDGHRALALAACAAFLVVGIPYWARPLSGLSLPRDILGVPLVAVGVLAALSCIVGRTGFWKTGLAVSASVPAAVMARVVCEASLVPGTHNLWPFELVLVAGPALAAGFCGAAVGSLLRRLMA